VRTVDGVNVAFWDIGQGVPVVVPPPAMPWSHVELEWQVPEWRSFYEMLAARYRVIRYDQRGMGLSSGEVPLDPQDVLVDLGAVMDKAGLESAVLFGVYYSAPTTIRFAAQHPERVSHLITWCGFSRSEEARQPGVGDAIEALMDADYELFTETLAHSTFGWGSGEPAHNLALYMQRSMTHERMRGYWQQVGSNLDVDEYLPLVKAKTLVLHRREFPFVTVDVAQKLAATIPNSRLVILEGASLSPWSGDVQAMVDMVGEFISDHPLASSAGERRAAERATTSSTAAFRTIMFTDITDSTSLTQRLGDAKAQELVRAHNQIVREALRVHGGSEVKHTGDGIMASFPSASAALQCAIDIERSIAKRNRALDDDQQDSVMSVHIGVNAGEPVAEGTDLFGTAVQLARRICDEAGGGEVFVADVVRQLAAGKEFLFSDRGESVLRGFEDPVRLYELHWQKPD
jgi:class 3 adenylate cyclase/pimeloyl-ACP methyl ester carboxylesterase